MMVCCRRATSHIHRPTSAALLMMDCCGAVIPRILPSYHHRPSSSSGPLGSNNNGDGALIPHSSTATRRYDDDMSAGNGDHQEAFTAHRRSRLRRETLTCGRARRKWISKQKRRKEEEVSSTTDDESNDKDDGGTRSEVDNNNLNKTENIKDKENDEYIPTFMRPQPIGNPIRERYIRSQRKIKFPRSIEGWKLVWRRSVATYLWTFEGVFTKEKRRDERGNILPDHDDIEEEEEEEDSSVEASKKEEDNNNTNNNSLHDKATDAAGTIVHNVQKNISTMKEQTPKLIEMGKEMTGVSNKDELREWVSDQLRLGTACLTEFMRGYRKGRDEEMDRMLHEYFKELDEIKNNESDATTNAAVDPKIDGDDNSLPNEEDVVAQQQHRKTEKRPWGRNERRRIKALANKISTKR